MLSLWQLPRLAQSQPLWLRLREADLFALRDDDIGGSGGDSAVVVLAAHLLQGGESRQKERDGRATSTAVSPLRRADD